MKEEKLATIHNDVELSTANSLTPLSPAKGRSELLSGDNQSHVTWYGLRKWICLEALVKKSVFCGIIYSTKTNLWLFSYWIWPHCVSWPLWNWNNLVHSGTFQSGSRFVPGLVPCEILSTPRKFTNTAHLPQLHNPELDRKRTYSFTSICQNLCHSRTQIGRENEWYVNKAVPQPSGIC